MCSYLHIRSQLTMRRKPGALVPFELAICEAAANLLRKGDGEFHGYEIAKAIRDDRDARVLTGYGTLYRALDRLEQMGFLKSRWEDPTVRVAGRPPRRLYVLTAAGEAALQDARKAAAGHAAPRSRRRLAPA